MRTQVTEEAVAKHFYEYSYKELSLERGEAFALDKVQMYLQLIKEHGTNWVVGDCKLISTYQLPGGELATPGPIMMSVFYNPISNTVKQKHLQLHLVYDLIRSNAFEQITRQLRTITNRKARRDYKAKAFCYVTFSGIFTSRSNNNLIKHSRLICIDLDHLNERLQEIRAWVIADPATVMCFISPSGDGLKVIYEMDPEQFTQEQYYKAYSARLSNLDKINIDSSCKDVSRACFLPHDPEVFINPYFEKA